MDFYNSNNWFILTENITWILFFFLIQTQNKRFLYWQWQNSILPHSVEDYQHVSWKNYFVAAIHLQHDLEKKKPFYLYFTVILVVCVWGRGGGSWGILHNNSESNQRFSISWSQYFTLIVQFTVKTAMLFRWQDLQIHTLMMTHAKFGSNCQYVF